VEQGLGAIKLELLLLKIFWINVLVSSQRGQGESFQDPGSLIPHLKETQEN
jgi:hypothetical protein